MLDEHNSGNWFVYRERLAYTPIYIHTIVCFVTSSAEDTPSSYDVTNIKAQLPNGVLFTGWLSLQARSSQLSCSRFLVTYLHLGTTGVFLNIF